ncbi:MAG: Holliday junction resolvase RuvX [Bacilli bacterium]|nr:Holliday junction resolvase RuvX [Bacilli bacterium]
MRYLGLDLGTKTLGIAKSDSLGLIASSYKLIKFENEDYESLINPLKEIIDELKVDKLVLGLPKNMDNSLGFASERSLNFKKLIEDNINIEVILQDERLSSVEANNLMIMGDTSRKNRKEKVDALAATIILQRYLDQRKD